MTFLLDVNVLIALIDPAHVSHDLAHLWFEAEGRHAWATCPITENGVIRIIGAPRYPGSPGSPAAVARILAAMRQLPGHTFWPDAISLFEAPADSSLILSPGQVTDTYLLALAVHRGGRLATFDRHLSPRAVSGGEAALRQIG